MIVRNGMLVTDCARLLPSPLWNELAWLNHHCIGEMCDEYFCRKSIVSDN